MGPKGHVCDRETCGQAASVWILNDHIHDTFSSSRVRPTLIFTLYSMSPNTTIPLTQFQLNSIHLRYHGPGFHTIVYITFDVAYQNYPTSKSCRIRLYLSAFLIPFYSSVTAYDSKGHRKIAVAEACQVCSAKRANVRSVHALDSCVRVACMFNRVACSIKSG